MALLTQKVPLPYAKFDKFNTPYWQPRGWDWIDPAKDVEADKSAIDAGLGTITAALAKKGLDFKETIDKRAEEQAYIKKMGVTIVLSTQKQPPAQTIDEGGDTSAGKGSNKKV